MSQRQAPPTGGWKQKPDGWWWRPLDERDLTPQGFAMLPADIMLQGFVYSATAAENGEPGAAGVHFMTHSSAKRYDDKIGRTWE